LINRLTSLYKLQLIDDQLDELEEMRGDLPLAVQNLESRMNDIARTISEKESEQNESIDKRDKNEKEIERILENQKRFKAQLFSVRNNKEYDALTKEIDHSDEVVKRLMMENDALADSSKKLSVEIEEITPLLNELKKDSDEKKSDLDQIVRTHEKEEVKLREERKKVEELVKKGDYSAYMRIRKAKRGKGVVTIKRSACSGCQNIVPSQRQLEIRRNNKLFNCEYCGRILVSSEIAEAAGE
jgi:hypothetical protein